MPEVAGALKVVVCRAPHPVVEDIQEFRKELFVDRLDWPLRVVAGREVDAFDTADTVHCGVLADGRVVAGFRAVRTDRPYLAREVFPQLARFRPYPARPDIWEISRFGVLPGAGDLGRLTYGLMFRFAHTRRASALVAIADLTYERFLGRLGIRTRRYGPPQPLGATRAGRPLMVVAGEIPLAEQNAAGVQALLRLTRDVEIDDEALVFGRSRVSA